MPKRPISSISQAQEEEDVFSCFCDICMVLRELGCPAHFRHFFLEPGRFSGTRPSQDFRQIPQHIVLSLLEHVNVKIVWEGGLDSRQFASLLVGRFVGDSDRKPHLMFRNLDVGNMEYAISRDAKKVWTPRMGFVLSQLRSIAFTSRDGESFERLIRKFQSFYDQGRMKHLRQIFVSMKWERVDTDELFTGLGSLAPLCTSIELDEVDDQILQSMVPQLTNLEKITCSSLYIDVLPLLPSPQRLKLYKYEIFCEPWQMAREIERFPNITEVQFIINNVVSTPERARDAFVNCTTLRKLSIIAGTPKDWSVAIACVPSHIRDVFLGLFCFTAAHVVDSFEYDFSGLMSLPQSVSIGLALGCDQAQG